LAQELSEDVLITLRKIIRSIELHSRDLSREFGLTGPQLLVLKNIKAHNPCNVRDIAKGANLSSATVTAILDRLEQRSYAKRSRSSVDKRRVEVTLTEKAQKVLESGPTLLQTRFVKRFNDLQDWEQTLLLSSLQRISKMMDAENLNEPLAPVLASGSLTATQQQIEDYITD